MNLACTLWWLTPLEALAGCTLHAAQALGSSLADSVNSDGRLFANRPVRDTTSIGPVEWAQKDVDYSVLNIDGAGGAGGAILDNGCAQYANSRVLTPGGHWA